MHPKPKKKLAKFGPDLKSHDDKTIALPRELPIPHFSEYGIIIQ